MPSRPLALKARFPSFPSFERKRPISLKAPRALKESGRFLSKLRRNEPVNPADFHAPSAGRVVQAPGGYAAFVPAPLPLTRVLGVSGPTARQAIAYHAWPTASA
jgi:hypothetical protein